MCVVCMKGPWSERGADDCDAVAAGGARCVPRCAGCETRRRRERHRIKNSFSGLGLEGN